MDPHKNTEKVGKSNAGKKIITSGRKEFLFTRGREAFFGYAHQVVRANMYALHDKLEIMISNLDGKYPQKSPRPRAL